MQRDVQRVASVDSKGRVTLPQELREGMGDTVIVRKTRDGILLLPGARKDFSSEFLKLMQSNPKRTGSPENPSPTEMKKIWKKRI